MCFVQHLVAAVHFVYKLNNLPMKNADIFIENVKKGILCYKILYQFHCHLSSRRKRLRLLFFVISLLFSYISQTQLCNFVQLHDFITFYPQKIFVEFDHVFTFQIPMIQQETAAFSPQRIPLLFSQTIRCSCHLQIFLSSQ